MNNQKILENIKKDWGNWSMLFVNQTLDDNSISLRKDLKMIFINILSLLSDTTLTKGYLDIVNRNIEKAIKAIMEWNDKKLTIYLSGSILEFIENLINVCEDYEFYESCYNLKKILDGLYVKE